jgi:beta-phosphoglucomutase-like phosphatase (HAD superfamily)
VGVLVDRCLFVDDTAANVAATRDVEMASVHYRQVEGYTMALAPIVYDRVEPVRSPGDPEISLFMFC